MKKLLFSCIIVFSNILAFAQNDFEIAKNVDIFISVLNELNDKYADEISPGTLTQTAIRAMLKSLDPYTVYYPESTVEDARLTQNSDFGEIDITLEKIGSNIVITNILENGNSAKAGLQIGDRILKINGQSVENRSTDDVKLSMRGQPNSSCKIDVFRPYENKNLSFNVTRQKIKSPNVPYYGIISDRIGYIKLNVFMENAGKDVFDAFRKLKDQGIEYLILDLRDNGGGLLSEAVNIVNIFVDKDTKIVETKGKIVEMNNTYKTNNPAVDTKIPVVVLVNEHSASASEIVSGSLQDLDRAVIVGKKSFGKGLVQKVYPMDYNTSMKITVSKYYIPSGRCVQNIEYFDSDTTHGSYKIPDSLAVAYKTKNGRTVYDKGGVEPDITVDDTDNPEILNALLDSHSIFDFATKYHSKNQTIAPADKFEVSDNIYNDFKLFLNEMNFDYQSSLEEMCTQLENFAKDNDYFKNIEPSLNNLKSEISKTKKSDLDKFKTLISKHLAQEIVLRYYFDSGKLINGLHHDKDIDAARSILLDSARYKQILNSGK